MIDNFKHISVFSSPDLYFLHSQGCKLPEKVDILPLGVILSVYA